MDSGTRAGIQGWVCGLVAGGIISLIQFLPQPNPFNNVAATTLIWCIAVASMFLFTLGSD